MTDFEALLMDLLGDAGKYLSDAADQVATVCPECKGVADYKPPITQRDILIALLIDMGVKTTAELPGDRCPKCDGTGKIYDDQAILKAAAVLAAKDYRTEMIEALR